MNNYILNIVIDIVTSYIEAFGYQYLSKMMVINVTVTQLNFFKIIMTCHCQPEVSHSR